MAIYEVQTQDGQTYEVETPESSSPSTPSLSRFGGALVEPLVQTASAFAHPVQATQALPQAFAKSATTIPQWILNLGLPVAGGSLAGIPGMATGAMAAKGIELARNDRGLPVTFPQAFQTAGDIAMTGATTALGGKALQMATGGFRTLRIAHNVPLRAGFIRTVREAFLRSKKLAGETFGKRLDALAEAHPGQTIDLSMELARVQERTLNNPAFKSMLSRAAMNSKESSLVQSLINQPDVAQNLTMKETQSLKNVVGRMLKQKFQQVSPELTDAHLDANDFYHGIRLAQLKAFSEFSDIASAYHKALTNFRMVKPYLTPAALEPAILSRFGNRAEIQEAVRELLPKETQRELVRFIRANILPRRVKTAGAVGVGGLTIAEIIRRSTK